VLSIVWFLFFFVFCLHFYLLFYMHCVYEFFLHRTFGYLHLGFMLLFFPLFSGTAWTPHHRGLWETISMGRGKGIYMTLWPFKGSPRLTFVCCLVFCDFPHALFSLAHCKFACENNEIHWSLAARLGFVSY